ncbi:hypothetical protein [Clostridium porci]|uniref:Uncharacterized protein n=1 Tax=Clostridium porci TaxID=2605778 RepID=A0A7X2NKA8_9CLOT|nr:hypothetical protein [Clostridium porci]MSS36466.1 hypothetical protein [Clostridium porci]
MKKRFLMVATAAAMTMMMSMTALAAPFGNWQNNDTGWWWQRNNGSYPANEWKWIDGNGDGTAESYYFDVNGYLATNTAVDGYSVNADGAWTVDGVVQTRPVALDLGDEVMAAQTQMQTATDGAVMDGKSVEQIVVNPELVNTMAAGGTDYFSNKTIIEQGTWGPTYSVQYNNATLRIESGTDNWVNSIYGPAKVLLNNIPETGIELNAFYDNTGYESVSTARNVMASTGRSDSIFGLPTGSYRMGWGNAGKRHFEILLTAGNDGQWYIYPDSPVFMN